MKEFEIYNDLKIPPNCYFVVRADGWKFSRLTETAGYDKPFDEKFHDLMVEAISVLWDCGPFNPILAFLQSDEVSFLFDKSDPTFNRRVLKLCSLMSAHMTRLFNAFTPFVYGEFDARISLLPTDEDVINYMVNRQQDAMRNCLNGHAFWHLVQGLKYTRTNAAKFLNGQNTEDRLLFLERTNYDYENIPRWQKMGTIIKQDTYDKKGYDPIKKKEVWVERKKIIVLDRLKDFGTINWLRGFTHINEENQDRGIENGRNI